MKTSVGISLLLLLSGVASQSVALAQQVNFVPRYDIDTYMDAGISQVLSSPVSAGAFFGRPNAYIAAAFSDVEMVVDLSYNDKWLRVAVTDKVDIEKNDELNFSAESYLYYDAAVEFYDEECVCLVDNIVAEIHLNEDKYYEYYLIAMPLSMLSDEYLPFLRNRINEKNAILDNLMSADTEAMNKFELKQHNREIRDVLKDAERLLYAHNAAESTIIKANAAIEARLSRLVQTFSATDGSY